MSATRCTCLWQANPYVLVVEDPDCRALFIHITTIREVAPA